MAQNLISLESGDEATNTEDTQLDALPRIINDQDKEEKLKIDSYRNAYGNISATANSYGATIHDNEPEVRAKAHKYAEEKLGRSYDKNKPMDTEYKKYYDEGEKLASKEYEVTRQKVFALREKSKSYGLQFGGLFGDIGVYQTNESGLEKTLQDIEKAYKKGKISAIEYEEIKKAGEMAATEVGANPYAGMSEVVFTDSLKRKYRVEIKNGRFGEVTYEGKDEGKKSFRGCEVLPVKLYEQRKCFFCPLFAVVYRAADTMAVKSMSALADAFATLIALGLGIWIAFQTLTHVSSLTKQDAPKYLGNLVKQSFKFLIAFLLLHYTSEIYTWVVQPLLDAGLTFGQKMLFETHLYEGVGDSIKDESIVMNTVFFGEDLYGKLENFVTNVQREIAFMQSIGTTLMCIGGNLMIGIGGEDWEFGGGFQMLSQGLILAIFGFLLSLAFAFYLIDAVVQLGIVGALMPFLIACWPFKLTAQYTNKGFSMLLNSFFIFVFVGLVVSVNLQLIDAALVNGNTNQVSEVLTTQGQGQGQSNQIEKIKTGALGGIYEAINAQDEKKLLELTDIGGVGFLILLFCCIFGFKFCGQSSALADKMAGGGMKAIAPSIATMGASATLSAAKKVSQPMREAVADKAVELGGNALRKAGAFVTGRGGRHGQKPAGGGGEDSGSEESGTPESTTPENNKPRTLGQKGTSHQDGTPSKSGGPATKQGAGGKSESSSETLGQKDNGSANAGEEPETTAGRQRKARKDLGNAQGKPRRGKGGQSRGGSKKGNKKTAKKGKRH